VRWKDIVKNFDGTIVHLTMYGQRLDEALQKMPTEGKMLVMVGAEKVPPEVYERAHYNVSVGNQPHSEIAALSIFLYKLTKGKALYDDLNGRFTVIPNERGKTVVEVPK
jgi:tRNA (cytidine56-2'-O)-methyltransferase